MDERVDQRWIAAAQGGDLEAFRRLVELHQDKIYQFSLRLLGSHEDALEVSQDVFVRAFKALHRYRLDGRAKFSTWLYQIALNRCRDTRRSAAFHLSCLSLSLNHQMPELSSGEAPPDLSAELRDDVLLLQRGLLALPRRHREIIMLSAVQNLSHAECGLVLKCSERSIEGRLYRARKALRQWWACHADSA